VIVFKLEVFRGNQQRIVEAALDGVDVFVLMATGSGKSLCYQLPAVVREGTTVVVGPLVTLMDDQLHGLRQRKINCAKYEGTVSEEERTVILQELGTTIKILYTSPEQLHQSTRLRSKLQRLARQGLLQRWCSTKPIALLSGARQFGTQLPMLQQLKTVNGTLLEC